MQSTPESISTHCLSLSLIHYGIVLWQFLWRDANSFYKIKVKLTSAEQQIEMCYVMCQFGDILYYKMLQIYTYIHGLVTFLVTVIAMPLQSL